jgi:hypothetical protein
MSTIEFSETFPAEPSGANSGPVFGAVGLGGLPRARGLDATVEAVHEWSPVAALRSAQQEAHAGAVVTVVRDWIARIDLPRRQY